jgi:uncharacterized protein (TIGR03437 family)
MMRVVCGLFLVAAALAAQTADTAYFRAVMLPSNEVPAANVTATGVADLIAHVVRDSSGQIISGTVDFLVRTNFAAANTATGLHIHTGAAGTNGGVVIGTDLSAANNVPIAAGGTVVQRAAQVLENNTTGLTALRGMFQNPANYYVNIHTTDFAGGAMRGQLQPAAGTVLMGLMSSDNEVPAVSPPARGTAVVVAIGTLDSSGGLASGEVYQQTTYTMGDRGTFTGFHIHLGGAGANGPVVINSAIPAGSAIDANGTGVVGPFYTEIDPKNANQVLAFANLFLNPGANYINIHTNTHTGGVMRAQLRPTETMTFPVMMSSANEPTRPSVTATAPAVVTARVLRNEDGSIAAGTVFFDVNYRLPAGAQINGLHIHDGPAGVNGPVTIGMIPQFDSAFATATGFGNYYNWTQGVANLAILEDISKNPENHYVNIHTTVDGGGVARGQLAPANNSVPTVAAAIAANLDKNATTVAPGGLISIFGDNMAKVSADLSGWQGRVLPFSLNGVTVTVGGKAAPLLYVGKSQINAQVPVDVAVGTQQVVVINGAGASASFPVTVAAAAPAIFFSPSAAILKNSDFSLVDSSNPARSGDVVLVYATGFGATTPAITTGGLVQPGAALPSINGVTATVGGQNAPVVYAAAAPGFVGLYQVAVTVPAGLTGSQPLVLSLGSARSNSVNLAVR